MRKCVIIALAALAFASCKKEDPKTNPPTSGYGSGVLVTNEGVFQTGTGTLSFYDPDSKTIENEIYMQENGVPLGNVLQSATQVNNKLYLVVNNSQEVVVANATTMEHEATISGFSSPRYMHAVSGDKAYVTDWVSNEVAIVDLKSNTISGRIAVNNGPERMLQIGNQVFVANSGGFGKDSTVTIINAITDQVEGEIQVGINPNSLQVDVNGFLWVLCGGYSDWSNPANDIAGKLMQIDLSINTVSLSLDFPSTSDHPGGLVKNGAGTLLYYLKNSYAGEVYQMNLSSTSLPTTPYITGTFYALGVHPTSNDIYVTDPLDYNQRGLLYRYSKDAMFIDSLRAGIIPGNFLFR